MKFKTILLQFVFVNVLLLFPFFAHSQETETDLKSRAEKSFRADNFVDASKLYAQLLTLNARDSFYNFRYGICLIYNSRKKVEAIKHLNYASKEENTDPEVFFWLGKAYHLNYEFGEAIKYYNLYKTKVGAKINVSFNVSRQIEMSENGKRLLSASNEMVVLEKKEIESGNFFRLYDLKNIGGDILVNAQFQSKIDKKNKHVPLIHFPNNPSTIYYSSYGEDEKSGKDIFIRKRLPDGSWSLPQTINGGVNTVYDEDYPYMHPNGKYLYFSSKGHNSMGGYDVFRSKYDKATNTFGPAENLDFAISSPDNDLFYIVDSLDKNAYFASNRQSLDDKIHVYKVRVEFVPIQLVVIKAGFASLIKPDNKKVSVEIFDFATNTKVGTFNSTDKGNVLMTFPKGGKYEYQIKVDGNDNVFKAVVNVPFLTELKPLKQKLIHEKGESGELVKVVNLFDEAVEDPVATLAEIARNRAELNPNADQFDLNKLDNSANNKAVYAEIGYGKLTDREVKENIEKLAVNQENQTANLEKLQQKANDIVVNNVKEITQLQAELKTTVAQAETKSGSEKRELFEKAAGIVNELNRLEKESKALIPYSDSLKGPIAQSKKEDIEARKMADDIKKAFNDNNPSLIAQKITENKSKIIELQKENSVLASEGIVKNVVAKRDDIKKLTAKEKEYVDMKIKAKEEILDLDIKLTEAKSKDQEPIKKKIADKQEEIKMVDEELKAIQPKLTVKKEELKVLEQKLNVVQDIQNVKVPETKTNSADANKALLASDNANTRTLKSYVEEQSKQLGFDMYAQKTVKKDNSTSNKNTKKEELSPSQKDLAAQVFPDYAKNMDAIQNDVNLNEEQKIVTSQKQDKLLKFQIAKELNASEEALKQNPSDKSLEKKIADLKKINETLNSNIEAQQNNLNQKYPETYPKKMISENQLANRIKSNHFAVLMAMEESSSVADNKQIEKAQKEDQEFTRLMSLEKNKLENVLKTDPINEEAIHELGLIKKMMSDTDKRIERRTMGMAAFTIPDNNKVDETYVSVDVKENKTTENKATENNSKENKTTENKVTENNSKENKTTENNVAENNSKENKTTENKVTENNSKENKTTENKVTENNSKENKTTENNVAENNSKENKTTENNVVENNSKENKTTENQVVENNTKENKTTENKVTENNSVGIAPDFESIKEVSPSFEKNINAIKNNKSYDQKTIQNKLVIEENKLQKSADTELAELDKAIQKNPSDVSLTAKKDKVLAVKQQSEDRENEAKQVLISEEKKTIKKEDLIKLADKTYSEEIANQKSPDDLIKREEKLQENLETKIAANEKRIAANENIPLIAENQVLNELLDESKGKVEVIKNPALANSKDNKTTENKSTEIVKDSTENKSTDSKTNNVAELNAKTNEDKVFNDLTQQEANLQTQLNNPDLPKEDRKKLTTELLDNQAKQTTILAKNTQEQGTLVSQLQKDSKILTAKSDKSINAQDTVALSIARQNELDIIALQKDLSKAKKESKKAEILKELTEKQKQNKAIYEDVAYSKQMTNDVATLQTIEPKATSLSLESTSTLERRKASVTAEIESLKMQLEKDKSALKEAKSDDKAVIAKRIVANEKRIDLLKDEVKAIDLELKTKSTEASNNKLAQAPTATYSEEEKKSLSQVANYKELQEAYTAKQDAVKTKVDAYNALEQAKTSYAEAVANQAKNPSAENQQKVKATLNDVVEKTKAYQEASKKQTESLANYQNLSKDQSDIAKLEKMFSDGVEANFVPTTPIENNLATTETVPFKIFEAPQTESAEERIKVGEEMPMGLVFRVQVGAFRKPLKSKMYAEFTPVTGEPIKDGIVRYITGYFGSLSNASTAKKAIRTIGYKDAFIVAYCDGKRISIAKAKKLIASGQCVPNPASSGDLEIASNTTPKETKSPKETKTTEKENKTTEKETKTPVDKTEKSNPKADYNKAPGAVKAIAVETKLGLFYTVQIGAYKKPATAKQLKFVENVVSKLLPDGMIRYSTGIFQSVEAAIPTKNEVIGKGITDAFVTAYYQGERISLAEATRLLKEKGEGILEKP